MYQNRNCRLVIRETRIVATFCRSLRFPTLRLPSSATGGGRLRSRSDSCLWDASHMRTLGCRPNPPGDFIPRPLLRFAPVYVFFIIKDPSALEGSFSYTITSSSETITVMLITIHIELSALDRPTSLPISPVKPGTLAPMGANIRITSVWRMYSSNGSTK